MRRRRAGPAGRLAIVRAAHEDFASQLLAASIGAAVLRPTGDLSDLGEVLEKRLRSGG